MYTVLLQTLLDCIPIMQSFKSYVLVTSCEVTSYKKPYLVYFYFNWSKFVPRAYEKNGAYELKMFQEFFVKSPKEFVLNSYCRYDVYRVTNFFRKAPVTLKYLVHASLDGFHLRFLTPSSQAFLLRIGWSHDLYEMHQFMLDSSLIVIVNKDKSDELLNVFGNLLVNLCQN